MSWVNDLECPLSRERLTALAAALVEDGDLASTYEDASAHLDTCPDCLTAFSQVLAETQPEHLAGLRAQLQAWDDESLLDALSDPLPQVRLTAIAETARPIYREVLDTAALPRAAQIEDALRQIAAGDDDKQVMAAAADALGVRGALGALAALAADDDEAVAEVGRRLLGRTVDRLREGGRLAREAASASRAHVLDPARWSALWAALSPGEMLPAMGGVTGEVKMVASIEARGDSFRARILEFADNTWELAVDLPPAGGRWMLDAEQVLFADPGRPGEVVAVHGPPTVTDATAIFALNAADGEAIRAMALGGRAFVIADGPST